MNERETPEYWFEITSECTSSEDWTRMPSPASIGEYLALVRANFVCDLGSVQESVVGIMGTSNFTTFFDSMTGEVMDRSDRTYMNSIDKEL